MRRLCRADRCPVVGGTLLGIDGAVLDAGGTLERGGGIPKLAPRHRGLPAYDLPEGGAETAVVSGDCVGLRKGAVAYVRELALHAAPDTLLTAAAAKLGARTLASGRFVRYREATPSEAEREVEAQTLALILEPSLNLPGVEAQA
jgi:hypothetical protein